MTGREISAQAGFLNFTCCAISVNHFLTATVSPCPLRGTPLCQAQHSAAAPSRISATPGILLRSQGPYSSLQLIPRCAWINIYLDPQLAQSISSCWHGKLRCTTHHLILGFPGLFSNTTLDRRTCFLSRGRCDSEAKRRCWGSLEGILQPKEEMFSSSPAAYSSSTSKSPKDHKDSN